MSWKTFNTELLNLLIHLRLFAFICVQMLILKNEITIRPMKDDIHDYQLIEKWRSDEKVLQFYGGTDNPYDLEKVIETYQPRIKGEESLIYCIFSYQNREIGYLQYYDLDKLPENIRQMYCLEKTALLN
ncbi:MULTISPECIES: hypothetical protein [Nostocales]|uniref:hypothetical protein n=1 Tax=Nostocales TaxID=1161 RepID=UPI00029B7C3C|nr:MULTISPECIES: hypothetical protein [Nostocales]AFW94145.1 hypothetical protein ANA_C11366 [Anabaena sp. 90]